MDTEWHWSSHHHHQCAGGNERIPGQGTRDRRLETQMRLEFLVRFFLFFFFFYWLLIITLLVQDYDNACIPPQARDDNNNNKGWDREDKGTGQGFESQARLEPQVRVFKKEITLYTWFSCQHHLHRPHFNQTSGHINTLKQQHRSGSGSKGSTSRAAGMFFF